MSDVSTYRRPVRWQNRVILNIAFLPIQIPDRIRSMSILILLRFRHADGQYKWTGGSVVL